MNEKCKYCDYVSQCSRICEYGSILCKLHRSFPKVVNKSYEQLQQENKRLNGAIQTYDILLKSNVEENKQLSKDIDMWNKKYNNIFDENKRLKIQISAREEVCNRLENNWNKLKKQVINRFNESQNVQFLDVLQDMQKLEQGSDE